MPATPRVLILRAPGTNCDEETAFAFEQAGARAERVHVNRLVENPTLSSRYQILCLPGGFSFGDDIAAGRILASRLQQHLGDQVREFCHQDRLVLGICNGFQVLMRMGLLSGPLEESGGDEARADAASTSDCEGEETALATLTWNDHGRFEDRWVHLRVDPASRCVFLRGIERMYLPVAHGEGKFVAASESVCRRLARAGRLALRYAPADSAAHGADDDLDAPLPFPANPNGAQANVAGMSDASGRRLGLMPHPERHLDPTHHPFWTRRDAQPKWGDGYALFKNAVDYFA